MADETTGWKEPTMVAQYVIPYNVNNATCYEFSDLDHLINGHERRYAEQIPHEKRAVDLYHPSPKVYAYNYGFNIPEKSTITKISLFAKVNQITRPLPKFWEQVHANHPNEVKRPLETSLSKSLCKFSNVRLKQGKSLSDDGLGEQMADKCKVPMLPYKQWSSEATTTFSGTPKEWGLTAKDPVSVINQTIFGVVIQFKGIYNKGWVNPAIAGLRLKIDYKQPQIRRNYENKDTVKNTNSETPSTEENESEILGMYVSFDNSEGEELKFDVKNDYLECSENNRLNLTRGDYDHPVNLSFNFYHRGISGNSPVIIFRSSDLAMGADANAYLSKSLSWKKFTLPSVTFSEDKVRYVYGIRMSVFPGVMLGKQTVEFYYEKKKYVIEFNVSNKEGETPAEQTHIFNKNMFLDEDKSCVVQNCYFGDNCARNTGGAGYITTEYYYPLGNKYVSNKCNNIRDNEFPCVNTFWLNSETRKPGGNPCMNK